MRTEHLSLDRIHQQQKQSTENELTYPSPTQISMYQGCVALADLITMIDQDDEVNRTYGKLITSYIRGLSGDLCLIRGAMYDIWVGMSLTQRCWWSWVVEDKEYVHINLFWTCDVQIIGTTVHPDI
eukprot:26442_1